MSNRYNDNTPLEVIARNTQISVNVVKGSNLDNEDTMMIKEHKRLFPTTSMFPSLPTKKKK